MKKINLENITKKYGMLELGQDEFLVEVKNPKTGKPEAKVRLYDILQEKRTGDHYLREPGTETMFRYDLLKKPEEIQY
ncbi:MAG: hypothetical protein KKA79_03235 [Nanoarchaeota archaeon]|nr:hypothetical protein [Nanoarchaeota archaeon]MCG2718755.1 hypothetical protein [Nanoarchaeota archaeon]